MLKYIFYKIGPGNMSIHKYEVQEKSYYTEDNEFFRSYQKARYYMLLNRLEKEESLKRQNKIKVKLKQIMELFPNELI